MKPQPNNEVATMTPNTNRFLSLIHADEKLGGKLGISTLDIAMILEKPHKELLKIMRKEGVITEGNISLCSGIVGSTYTGGNGKELICFICNRSYTGFLINRCDSTFYFEFEEAFDLSFESAKKPLSTSELLLQCVSTIEDLTAENKAQALKITTDAPAVAFAKEITAVKMELTPSRAGKELGFKPNLFMAKLREDGYLCKLKDINGKKLPHANEPAQRYIEQDLFSVSMSSYLDAKKMKMVQKIQTYITVKGQAYFHELYRYDEALKA